MAEFVIRVLMSTEERPGTYCRYEVYQSLISGLGTYFARRFYRRMEASSVPTEPGISSFLR